MGARTGPPTPLCSGVHARECSANCRREPYGTAWDARARAALGPRPDAIPRARRPTTCLGGKDEPRARETFTLWGAESPAPVLTWVFTSIRDLGQTALRYSWMSPPRTSWRWIRGADPPLIRSSGPASAPSPRCGQPCLRATTPHSHRRTLRRCASHARRKTSSTLPYRTWTTSETLPCGRDCRSGQTSGPDSSDRPPIDTRGSPSGVVRCAWRRVSIPRSRVDSR